MIARFLIILFSAFFICQFNCITKSSIPAGFKLGDEVLLQSGFDKLKDKRVAIVTNQTGIDSKGNHIADLMMQKKINVVKLFSPEHGIRGDENYTGTDIKTGLPVVSLYNDLTEPANKDLQDVDVLIYDIQDVGARFYTYTTTLHYIIMAAVNNNIQLIVCDRPVIINPDYVDGFMLDDYYGSFVGRIPTPVCYGLTCGELANYLNKNVFGSSPLVEISKMEGYSRSTDFESLNLAWVKPSPSMFYSSTAQCYPGTCFLEGTNVSEGRGTDKPFEYAGSPWIDAAVFAEDLNSYKLAGVTFEAVTFTPSEKISAYPPKFFNEQCNGVFIKVTDKNSFEPVKTGIAVLLALKKFPEFKLNKDNYIDKLAGTNKLRKMISDGKDFNTIVNSWQADTEQFKEKRKEALLY
jgi:uncharacterized protein YbbC (DUF1343 family)